MSLRPRPKKRPGTAPGRDNIINFANIKIIVARDIIINIAAITYCS